MGVALRKLDNQHVSDAQIALMDEFYAATQPITDSNRRLFNGNVEIELDYDPRGGIELGIVNALETRQRHGVEALKFIKSLADKFQLSIYLDAEPLDGSPISRPRLKRWYEENGFSRNGGSGMRYFPKPSN